MSSSSSYSSPSSGGGSSADEFPLRPRWFYAREGDWVVFSESDDKELESRFQEVGGEEWALKHMEEQKAKDEKEKEHEGGGDDAPQQSHAEKKEEDEKREVRKEAALVGVDFKESGWLGAFSSWWSPPSLGGAKDDKSEASQKKKNDDDDKPPMVEEILDPDESESDRKYKVPVLEDKLFDVDLEKMTLYPVFFKGVLLPVVRATWFYWSEVREEYSPISWASDLGQDLSKAWKESQAWQLGKQSRSKDKDKAAAANSDAPLIEIRCGEGQGSDEKAKVKFKSAITASIFSEDVRGKVVSLVGGFTVIRGFEEVERRTQEAKKGGKFFDMPDVPVPWGSKGDDDDGDDEAANQAQLNDAVKSSKKSGAAQPDGGKKNPPAAGGGYGSNEKSSSKGQEEAADNQGFAASLWPKSDSWLRPRFAFLKSLGFSSDDATEEAKRTQKQKNTEHAAEPESENKKRGEGVQGEGDDGEDAADDNDEDLESRKDDPIHLILVIHGIGQGLRDTFESLDFTYDVQKIRNLSRATAKDDGIRRLSKGRRVQYIPICWRRDLDFNYKSDENDNQFGLADVTNDATIPFVRNVVSKVILDVPYYLSDIHKPKMINAVTYELNRVYRLFVRRNPDFIKKGGKVSIIGHSLGSCLAADILSEQPTHVPSIEDMTRSDIQTAMTERLLFNTTHVFLVGSPLGLFLHLSGGQLIARRTEARSELGDSASHQHAGKTGCLAFSGNLYNCYNSADPVAYRLNGTVDQKYATLIRPVPLPGAINAILDFLKQPRLVISKLFDPQHPFSSSDQVHNVAKKVSRESLGDSPGPDVQAKIKLHEVKAEKEQAETKRYAETHDGAVNSLASRAARTANQLAKSDSQDGARSGIATPDDHSSEIPSSGVMSPVRLEEGSSAKAALPSRLVSAHADALKKDSSVSSSSGSHLKAILAHLQKAEKRFRALNKHGCIDFFFEDSGSISEYFSMLGAHNGYWTSASFVSLVLSQVFDDNEDGPSAARLVPTIERPVGGVRRKGAVGDGDGKEESEDDDETDEETDGE